MICQKCGKSISDGTKSCPYCGQEQIVEVENEETENEIISDLQNSNDYKKHIPAVTSFLSNRTKYLIACLLLILVFVFFPFFTYSRPMTAEEILKTPVQELEDADYIEVEELGLKLPAVKKSVSVFTIVKSILTERGKVFEDEYLDKGTINESVIKEKKNHLQSVGMLYFNIAMILFVLYIYTIMEIVSEIKATKSYKRQIDLTTKSFCYDIRNLCSPSFVQSSASLLLTVIGVIHGCLGICTGLISISFKSVGLIMNNSNFFLYIIPVIIGVTPGSICGHSSRKFLNNAIEKKWRDSISN